MKQFVAETSSLVLTEKKLAKKRILCSFSGGQDSTILFFALFHTKILNKTIHLLYFHHFWQIQNFQASKAIFYLSFNLKVPYTVIMANLFLSNENRSRNWRKKNLFRFSNLQQNSIVITGHTQTDRLERNLNNLIRGASSKGVSSLKSFGELGDPGLNTAHLVFSRFFIALRLITHPKQIKIEKKIRLKSKLFFSKTNIFPEKVIYPVLEMNFVINSRIDTLERFNHFKWPPDPILLKSKNQSTKIKKKYNKFSFFQNEKTKFSQNVEKKKLFDTYFLPQKHVSVMNRNYIKTSQSFCFSKFSEKRTIHLQTPLKNQNRVIVSKLAKIYRLSIFHDLTNFSSYSTRNKIRHIAFPLLGSLFHKKINFSLTQFFSTLSYEISECENFSEKVYFLLIFCCISSVCYSKIAANLKNFSTEMLKCKVLCDKETQAENFEIFLLMFLCRQSEIKNQPLIIKKILSYYTERALSYNQLRKIQKILAI